MLKPISRIIAVLLIPCLLTEQSFAIAQLWKISPTSAASPRSIHASKLQENALEPVGLWMNRAIATVKAAPHVRVMAATAALVWLGKKFGFVPFGLMVSVPEGNAGAPTKTVPEADIDKRAQAYIDHIAGRPNDFRLTGEVTRKELNALKSRYDVILGAINFSQLGIYPDDLEGTKEAIRQEIREHLSAGRKVLAVSDGTTLAGANVFYDVIDEFKGQVDSLGIECGIALPDVIKVRNKGPEEKYEFRRTTYIYFEEEGSESKKGAVKGGWGTESPVFIDFISHLIMFGGGPQASRELRTIAQQGKPVTIVEGVRNRFGQYGQAELSYLNAVGRKDFVLQLKEQLEKATVAGQKNWALEAANAALEYELPEAHEFKLRHIGDSASSSTQIEPLQTAGLGHRVAQFFMSFATLVRWWSARSTTWDHIRLPVKWVGYGIALAYIHPLWVFASLDPARAFLAALSVWGLWSYFRPAYLYRGVLGTEVIRQVPQSEQPNLHLFSMGLYEYHRQLNRDEEKLLRYLLYKTGTSLMPYRNFSPEIDRSESWADIHSRSQQYAWTPRETWDQTPRSEWAEKTLIQLLDMRVILRIPRTSDMKVYPDRGPGGIGTGEESRVDPEILIVPSLEQRVYIVRLPTVASLMQRRFMGLSWTTLTQWHPFAGEARSRYQKVDRFLQDAVDDIIQTARDFGSLSKSEEPMAIRSLLDRLEFLSSKYLDDEGTALKKSA